MTGFPARNNRTTLEEFRVVLLLAMNDFDRFWRYGAAMPS
jgi:hypothetical protein